MMTSWTEPGAFEVAPGVYRIPLPLPDASLHAVNVYLVEDPDGLVLIDAGWAMPETERAMSAALASLGHRLNDITQFVVTHAHWDHYTQALALRERFGSRVRLGRGEQRSITDFTTSGQPYPHQFALLLECGATQIAAQLSALPLQPHEIGMPFGPPDEWADDGDRISLKARTLDVHATPGHTRGHIVLRDAEAGLLFAGDHVLPHITPSIGLERTPEPAPLRSYLASLRLVRDMPDTLLLPAHGPVTASVHHRVDELLSHHEQRLLACTREIRLGAQTAFDVAAAMPWTRKQRRLADLSLLNQVLAVLETEAHLALLAEHRLLTASAGRGIRTYALA